MKDPKWKKKNPTRKDKYWSRGRKDKVLAQIRVY